MKRAFTLFEVLLALAILTGSVFVLSQLHMRSLFRVVSDRDDIEKIFLIKKDVYSFFFKHDNKKLPTRERPTVHTLEIPEMKISSYTAEVDQKSSLKKFKDKILMVYSDAEWKNGTTQRQTKMLTFVLKPPKEKEKR